jgi:uncharacterized FlgJ-related protein
MNKFWQVIVVVVLILVAFTLYWTRYQVVTANYAYAPAFYKIDRLSGEVTLTVGKEYVKVESVEAKKTAEVPVPPSAPKPPAQQPLPAPPQPSKQ